ncbi:MAG: potassium transporter TrkG [Blautia sp.]|nr:potassium transporter TrkG [Blautia sp.]
MKNKMQSNFGLHKLNTAQIITLGFAGVIFLGGIILWLPFCTAPGNTTSFTDAMFTSATSVCVTGLVTVVTASHWTLIGKIIILMLIQVGGVGLISLGSIIFISLHKKISLRNQRMIQESYNLDKIDGMVSLVKKVLICVFGAEAIGTVCYASRFVPEFGPLKGLGCSVFTAVSAFCNAGVDILGENSLAPYVSDPVVNFTTMGLVIMAGLGFVVWWDLWDNLKKVIRRQMPFRRLFRNLRLHSKIVLSMTGILIFGGAALILIFDWNNPESIGNLPVGTRVMASFFQSITTRTAGFFTVSQETFSHAAFLLCLLLMFVGGSPMGTAGGIKTTSLAVLILNLKASIQGKKDVEVFYRKIRENYIRSAMAVAGMGILVILVMSMLLCMAMPHALLEDVLYEITSAIATVGLSRGLTSQLNFAGKWIVILTMYLGRIGPLTLGMAVIVRTQKLPPDSHLAEEDIMIG